MASGSKLRPPEAESRKPEAVLGTVMTLSEILRQAFSTFRAHKMRTFLTMFGIVWGTGSGIQRRPEKAHAVAGQGPGYHVGRAHQFAGGRTRGGAGNSLER